VHTTDSPLDGIDKHLLFDFIDACHTNVKTSEDDVIRKLRRLMSHDMFAYGTIDFGAERRLRHLGGNFPESIMDEAGAGRSTAWSRNGWARGSRFIRRLPTRQFAGLCA